MVETRYALAKFIAAKDAVYADDERGDTEFLFNVETHAAYINRQALLDLAQEQGVDGVVFSRVDFLCSTGASRESINADIVTAKMCDVAAICQRRGLQLEEFFMTNDAFTLARARVLEAIDALTLEQGYPPTIREVCQHLGLSSPASVQQQIQTLARLGLVVHHPGIPRTLRVVKPAPQPGEMLRNAQIEPLRIAPAVIAPSTQRA